MRKYEHILLKIDENLRPFIFKKISVVQNLYDVIGLPFNKTYRGDYYADYESKNKDSFKKEP